jgi:hypothetical protein
VPQNSVNASHEAVQPSATCWHIILVNWIGVVCTVTCLCCTYLILCGVVTAKLLGVWLGQMQPHTV